MRKTMLLDCTLRDGGYINDWNFGHDNLVSVFERVVEAGIDIIEIGFLDERRVFDMNRSIMPDSDCVKKIYGNLDKKKTMVVGMIDYGTCGLANIKPCSESFLDGIRVIFKKHVKEQALSFCAELKELGYRVFAQLVSVTSYSDEEMLALIKLANEVRPYAVSMVDTYGLMHQNNLQHYFDLLNKDLDISIGIGYHAHNNFQMGYANCIKMLSNSIERDIIVDGSMYGMGKSAGNAPLELIAMYMNDNLGKDYDISQILEAIDSNILQFYRPATWGYNMFFYLAAANDCHPNYVSYLMEKRTLSIKSIYEILGKLEGEKQLLYDKNYIERLYMEYQDNEINDKQDKERLEQALKGKEILVLGPGMTMQTEKPKIDAFIEAKKPVIISINYVPEWITPSFIFLSNSKRYVQLATRLSQNNYSIIATSNVTGTCQNAFEYILNFSTLMDAEAEFIDNSLVMFLKALTNIGITEVTLAGFDGYTRQASNYYKHEMEYDFVKNKADYLNAYTTDFLKSIRERMQVLFLTKSCYEESGSNR